MKFVKLYCPFCSYSNEILQKDFEKAESFYCHNCKEIIDIKKHYKTANDCHRCGEKVNEINLISQDTILFKDMPHVHYSRICNKCLSQLNEIKVRNKEDIIKPFITINVE